MRHICNAFVVNVVFLVDTHMVRTLICLVVALGLAPQCSLATTIENSAKQDSLRIQQTAETFLLDQMKARVGKAHVVVVPVDPRLKLPACNSMEAFSSSPGKMMGNISVGVRCRAPNAWTVYLSAQVQLFTTYLTAAVPLRAGQNITQNDVVAIEGDVAALPAGVFTDAALVVGQTTAMSFAAGTPIRRELLKSAPGVQQGQTVRIIAKGVGFQVSVEGRAMQTGVDGQVVQVRTNSGQVISGTARLGGNVEVSN